MRSPRWVAQAQIAWLWCLPCSTGLEFEIASDYFAAGICDGCLMLPLGGQIQSDGTHSTPPYLQVKAIHYREGFRLFLAGPESVWPWLALDEGPRRGAIPHFLNRVSRRGRLAICAKRQHQAPQAMPGQFCPSQVDNTPSGENCQLDPAVKVAILIYKQSLVGQLAGRLYLRGHKGH